MPNAVEQPKHDKYERLIRAAQGQKRDHGRRGASLR